MRNLTILILSFCLLTLNSCVRADEPIEREPIAKNKVNQQKKEKNPIDKSKIKNDIQNNNNLIKGFEKEINTLLNDF